MHIYKGRHMKHEEKAEGEDMGKRKREEKKRGEREKKRDRDAKEFVNVTQPVNEGAGL